MQEKSTSGQQSFLDAVKDLIQRHPLPSKEAATAAAALIRGAASAEAAAKGDKVKATAALLVEKAKMTGRFGRRISRLSAEQLALLDIELSNIELPDGIGLPRQREAGDS